VANERETHKLRCALKIRNRGDQSIRKVEIRIRVATADGGGGWEYVGLQTGVAAGQEVEEQNACGVNGSGRAPGSRVRILVFVNKVGIGDYYYLPSKRIAQQVALSLVWLSTPDRRAASR
jgi:hypothetical protein